MRPSNHKFGMNDYKKGAELAEICCGDYGSPS